MTDVRHVLGISGGRDSAALAVFMRQNHSEFNIEYFFTDTGQELPEVYEFLGLLEGFLGKEIVRLNPQRNFKFWLEQYGHFLPSPNTRWCTRQLKLRPFELWIKPWLNSGIKVFSYVAIRSDEDHREGFAAKHPNLSVVMPLRIHGINKAGVIDLLNSAGIGLPKYYDWRSRSGCTFCFFQQKIEWVNLYRHHPSAFDEAVSLEKTAASHGSPFSWCQGEPLEELIKPERILEIESDYKKRLGRLKENAKANPLHPSRDGEFHDYMNLDDVYGLEEGAGSCLVCHK